MKKLILSSLIAMMLFCGTANAGVVAAIALGPPTGGAGIVFTVALIFAGGAAGFDVGKFVREEGGSRSAAILAALGWAFLDEDRQVMVFKSIEPSNASKHGLTKDEAAVYNEDLEEINLAFDEFSRRYNGETITQEQATAAYNEVATDVGLSSGAGSVLSKVFVHALTEK